MSNLNKYALLMTLFGMPDIPKTEPREITYGAASVATSYDNMLLYLTTVLKDDGTIKSGGTHHLCVMVADCFTVWGKLLDDTLLTDLKSNTGTLNVAQLYYNIGRLVRSEHIEADDKAATLSLLEHELAKNINGTLQATHTINAAYLRLWYMIGAKLESIFGPWQDNKYRVETDVAAGLFSVLFYVVFVTQGQAETWNMLRRGIGTYTTIDGASRGNLVTFNKSDPSTWMAVMLSSVNGVANLFGMSEALVDDDTIRNGKIVTLEGAESFWLNWLSSSKWSWRYAKYTEVHPLFWIFDAETLNNDDGSRKIDHSVYDMCPLKSNTGIDADHNFRFLYMEILRLVNELVSFKFHSPKFANVKSLFKIVALDSLSIPSEGLSGLLLHQCTHWKEDAATDKCCNKFILDESNVGHKLLQVRRAAEQNTKILLIGDITIDQYRMINALTAITGVNYGGSQTTNLVRIFDIKGCWGFEILKDEDRPYMIDPTRMLDAIGYVNVTKQDSPIKATVHIPRTWVALDSGDLPDLTEEFVISTECPRAEHLLGRSEDPYKKLKHVIYDSNELDIDLMTATAAKAMLPFMSQSVESKASTIPVSPLPVSAVPASVVAAPTDAIDKKTNVAEVPVSAKPEKKEDKK